MRPGNGLLFADLPSCCYPLGPVYPLPLRPIAGPRLFALCRMSGFYPLPQATVIRRCADSASEMPGLRRNLPATWMSGRRTILWILCAKFTRQRCGPFFRAQIFASLHFGSGFYYGIFGCKTKVKLHALRPAQCKSPGLGAS